MDPCWLLEETRFEDRKRGLTDAPFSLGNGYMGCRGFCEEEQDADLMLGGIYLAGVVGRGDVTAWDGKHQELVNTPNCFHVRIEVDGETVLPREQQIEEYRRALNMRDGILDRSYVWTGQNGQQVRVAFQRFVSLADPHLAAQRIEITALSGSPTISIRAGIHADVTNLVTDTLNPVPTRPGLRHLETLEQTTERTRVRAATHEDQTVVVQGQVAELVGPGGPVSGKPADEIGGTAFRFRAKPNRPVVLTKLVYTYTSRDGRTSPETLVDKACRQSQSYDDARKAHCRRWRKRWHMADIQIESHEDDQRALRFNIFHLMQGCPAHDHRLSLGARGLTGEMHEGGVFWDTEIFKVPFFTFTDPKAARSLLRYRYVTLPAARKHAKELWFEGAMYAWKSGVHGAEQTEKNVGAYYAIHIVADIAYAIRQYWDATGDEAFLEKYGAEILIETARFWASRAHYDAIRKCYTILAVRGPNEYDVIVNNNLYTNRMATENLASARKAIAWLQSANPERWRALAKKLAWTPKEESHWKRIEKGIRICHDKAQDLYVEDDMYQHRVPFDKARGKPTGRRVVDSTLPYEAMAMYQITKQSDVVTLMNLLPHAFTDEQKRVAYEYYEPRTVHDSSLSYSPYGVMAARLGKDEEAYRYFVESAYLDLNDGQLNTLTGLHYANLGGTWQIAAFGFAGIRMNGGALDIRPNVPKAWGTLQLRIQYKGVMLRIQAQGARATVTAESLCDSEIKVRVNGRTAPVRTEE